VKACSIYFVGLSFWALNAHAETINLGTAESFVVLGTSTVTNTGPTVLNGDLGLYPGTSITGFVNIDAGPGTVNGTTHLADSAAQQARIDALNAYNFAANQTDEPCGDHLTGQDLGGLTLTPGVYCFSTSAQLTGTLTLNAQGNPNAIFLFQIGSTLTTASASAVDFINGGGQDGNLFWQVGSSATLGTTTAFEGSILADASITFGTGATIGCGRALALGGAVTMDTNTVGGSCENTTPEPGTATLISTGLLLSLIAYRWRPRKQPAT
jgi:type VI secretion system secreted protein VgrG